MSKMMIGNKIKSDPAQKEVFQKVFQEIAFAKKGQKCIVFSTDNSDLATRFLPLSLAAAVTADQGKQRFVVINGNNKHSSAEEDSGNAGLTNYLSGHCTLNEIIAETDLPQIDVIPVGRASMNLALLLEDESLKNIFALCRERYDWVLVNTAPLSENDMSAVHFARFCDGAVLLAKDHVTGKKWLKTAKAIFDQTGCPVEGCIVADAKKEKNYR